MKLNPKICTIGGGSGMPTVNRALIKAGFKNISSIVTTFDSGGDSGRMRTDERGRILAFSDYWRSLISLWLNDNQKDCWEEMLRYRDGRGRNFGNIFFQFMEEKTGDLTNVQDLFEKLTDAKMGGRVIPVSKVPADVFFKTKSKRVYKGEHLLDEMRMSKDKIVKMWIKPEVMANSEALKAINEAEIIIICPGSLYGSVLINLLPSGMSEAFNKSKAKKILMTNIMTVSLENDGFDQIDYVKLFEKYLGSKKPFDVIIMPDLGKLKKELVDQVLSFYECENSRPVEYDPGFETLTKVVDIATIEARYCRLRHSESKLAKLMLNLIL